MARSMPQGLWSSPLSLPEQPKNQAGGIAFGYIPKGFSNSTGGGILWPQRGQMFWKLGNLAPGAGGLLAVRVTYAWGLPDGLKTAIVAQLAGSDVNPELFNVAKYLAYSPRFETAVTSLSSDQVQALRASDPSMDAIYDQADAGSYEFGSATERTYNTGEVEAFIIWRLASGSVGVEIHSSTLTVYKPGQGLRFSLLTKLWEEVTADELAREQADEPIGWSECMLNCIEDKLPGEVAEQLIKAYSVGKKTVGRVKAATGDKDGILECSKIIDSVIPVYGTLAETAPTLTYTPDPNFAGLDRLVYTASNGTSTSRLAEVIFEVLPVGNGLAPTVEWTSPANGGVVNSSLQVAVREEGSLYTPYIQIQFSEPMAGNTINSTTVEVKDGTGRVVPSSVQYDPTLDQAVLLMHEQGQSGVTYTVTLKTGITDLSGAALAANYVWNFQFGDLSVPTPNVYFPFVER